MGRKLKTVRGVTEHLRGVSGARGDRGLLNNEETCADSTGGAEEDSSQEQFDNYCASLDFYEAGSPDPDGWARRHVSYRLLPIHDSAVSYRRDSE